MDWFDGNNERLRVLFPVRSDLQSHPGGDSTQILASARALRRHGVDVVVCNDGNADPGEFDLVHLWHLERVHETYIHLMRARATYRPVVLTPIYWPWRTGHRLIRVPGAEQLRRPWAENVRNVFRWARARSSFERESVARALRTGWSGARSALLKSAAAVLPNSRAEADQLSHETEYELPLHVVPNGVDGALCRQISNESPAGERTGVICVGSFDPRKNQLLLAKALRDTDIDLTFVGGPRRNHWLYFQRCRQVAGPRTRFLGIRSHEETLRIMAQARVLVSPSHLETPGLASLEAAAMGCSLALGDCAPVREYFGSKVAYLQSDNSDSLRLAVTQALQRSGRNELREHVLSNYTWDTAARALLDAYRTVLVSSTPLLQQI